MVRKRKDLARLEKEFKASFPKETENIYIVDTGAIIDLQRKADQGILHCRQENLGKILERFEMYGSALMTDKTYEEVKNHVRVMRNAYRPEISAGGLGKATMYNDNLKKYSLANDFENYGEIRLESYLRAHNHLAPLLSSENGDIPSETDLEIMALASTLVEIPILEGRKEKTISILTSDGGHVGRGGRILSEVYPNIKVIDTRK